MLRFSPSYKQMNLSSIIHPVFVTFLPFSYLRVIYNHYLYLLTHHFNPICTTNMLLKRSSTDQNTKFKRLSLLVLVTESENL